MEPYIESQVAPADALGSDNGHLGLTLTLDSDPQNYSAYAHTAGRSESHKRVILRGPDGTASSSGYGLIGDEADAWILVHNLGNADETPIIQVGELVGEILMEMAKRTM